MRRLAMLAALVVVGCDDPVEDAPIPYADECENLNAAHCLLPWPSDRFLDGAEISIDPAAMMVNEAGETVDPTLFSRFDGFSPMTSVMTSYAGELDTSLLHGELEIAATIEAGSTTVIVDAETGQLVAHFAEVDSWEETDPARAPLYLRPAARLEESRRYVVGIRGLATVDGTAIEPSAYFRALRDASDAPGTDVDDRRAHFDADVFPLLEAAGVERGELIEAWDFTTASGESIWGDLVAMRDEALAAVGDRGMGCTIGRVEDVDAGDEVRSNVWRRISGTVTVPLYLEGTAVDAASSRIHRGPDGAPMQNGVTEVPFMAQIPLSVRDAVLAGDAPARIELYGHGLFGAFTEIESGWHRDHQQRIGVVSIGVDWWGMAEIDVPRIVTTLQAFSDFDATGERLSQSVINALVLARSFMGVCSELPEMQVPMPDGSTMPAIDPTQLYYYGNSQGGIMGGVVAGVATDFDHFVMGVGGVSYPVMIKRSTNWMQYGAIMAVGYPDALERDLLMTMSASIWDLAEPSTYSPHLVSDPLPGTPPKRVLMQIGVGDAQVPNVAAHMQARTIGIPLLTPAPEEPWGIETVAGPVDSALVIYDIPDVPPQVPGTRNPGMDNPAHEGVRRSPAAQDQISAFARPDGRVEQTCDGICDPD